MQIFPPEQYPGEYSDEKLKSQQGRELWGWAVTFWAVGAFEPMLVVVGAEIKLFPTLLEDDPYDGEGDFVKNLQDLPVSRWSEKN